eukprot:CAMPEP_0168810340 /NCGR_PEP_ID=MMETSP0726-20121227/3551_1 /TAXON_ID=265536 /ORGANISM="Amphiprora sp., Strain CCMP467" /LENGTH=772 /DNA_ID=CAMNT_0008862353 /DNA_START=58 /DNA_END=2373 /DNA_ORIENTATION=+
MVILQKQPRSWSDFERGKNNASSESDGTTEDVHRDSQKKARDSGLAWMQQPVRADNTSVVPVAAPQPMLPPSSNSSTHRQRPEPSANAPRPNHARAPSPRAPSPANRKLPSSPASRNRGSRAPSPANRLRAPSPVSRTRAPSPLSRTRAPSPLSRTRAPSPVFRTRDPSPTSRNRAPSPANRNNVREPHPYDGTNTLPPSTTSSRGRSSTRASTRDVERERSLSQTRSIGGASHSSRASRKSKATTKKNVRSRPPVTTNGRDGVPSNIAPSRGRSRTAVRDGRARTDRSRSASVTRVTNTPQTHAPPASPSVRSIHSQSGNSTRLNSQRADMNYPSIRNTPNRTRAGARAGSEDGGGADGCIGRNISFGGPPGRSGSSVCSASSRQRKTTLGRLVGQGKKPAGFGDQIRPRVLLAATVYHNTATGLWITTINTNQKGVSRDPKRANKYLKAFSFPTEQEARESAIANAPPKMVPFGENNNCTICQSPFTMFKRASHCRNCGTCMCNECSVSWSAKNIPDTYNLKKESTVKICSSCNTISSAFRRSLLQGDFRGAVALYGTGNVNLRTPFPVTGKRDEVLWPIHCAVEGGNIDILRWLVEDHFCPITTIASAGKKPRRGAQESLISTSNDRNVLSIAIERLKIEMMQYLVVDRGVSIFESAQLEPSLRALEATLVALPRTEGRHSVDEAVEPRWDNRSFQDDMSIPSTIGIDDGNASVGGYSTRTKSSDYCIICCERKIDCVATPCGHQCLCMQCSSSLTSCPVCNRQGDFIK